MQTRKHGCWRKFQMMRFHFRETCPQCFCCPRYLFVTPGLMGSFPFAGTHCRFCYGIGDLSSYLSQKVINNASASLSCLIHGCFVYFDLKLNVIGVVAVRTDTTASLMHFGACTELTKKQTYVRHPLPIFCCFPPCCARSKDACTIMPHLSLMR